MSGMAAALAQLHFLRPLWLLGLLALPPLAWWWRAHAPRRSVWQDAVDAHLLPHLLDASGGPSRRRWTGWFATLAAALAVLAMAGPSFRKVELPLWQAKAPLVVALDLSSATLARDLPPSRLAQARAKIATLLRERAGGQVALVAFADDAYTVAPLTEDAANVALFLDALAPEVMPEDGHRADRAIAWSQRLLRSAGFDRGDILLLTDRADAADVAEAAQARMAGYRVSALGLGTGRGGVFDIQGGLGNARLDAAGLQRLAASGGGAYRPLAAGDADLRALGVLDPKAGDGAASRGEKAADWRDDGYWLLPLALLLALPLFRRGGAFAAMLALALMLPVPRAQAQAQSARPPVAGGLWRRADQQAYARMQEGVAAYRRQRYDEAIDKFAGNPTADGQYNLGNALAKAGRYDEAIAAYDRALERQPGMPDAAKNRAVVEAARKRKPPAGGAQQKQDPKQQAGNRQKPQDGQGEARDKPQQGQQQQSQQQSQQGQQQQSQQQSQQQQSPQPSQPRDAQQQAQADAAQRQRMQEALRKRQGQQQAPGKPQQAKESAEQRERRIANQAQLQRVPDDPGALLRTRFRLEYERRQGRGP